MSEEMKMTFSAIVPRNGKKAVYVQFSDMEKNAEGVLPDCVIISNNGFMEEEVRALELYLQAHKKDILEMAGEVNIMESFMNEKTSAK